MVMWLLSVLFFYYKCTAAALNKISHFSHQSHNTVHFTWFCFSFSRLNYFPFNSNKLKDWTLQSVDRDRESHLFTRLKVGEWWQLAIFQRKVADLIFRMHHKTINVVTCNMLSTT